jgi:membrane protease YdiL (CAAX protease family)
MTAIFSLTRSSVPAILLSVAVQVSYHFYQGAPGAFSHVGWCTIYSLYYWKTKRILPVALAHNFVNFTLQVRETCFPTF